MKKTYLVKINYYGEVHSFYTTAISEPHAVLNATNRLAKRVKCSLHYVRNHLYSGGNKITTIEAPKP